MIYVAGISSDDFAARFGSGASVGDNISFICDDAQQGLQSAKSGDVLAVGLLWEQEAVVTALKIGRRKGMITVFKSTPAATLIKSEIYENSEIIVVDQEETRIITGVEPDCEVNLALAVKKFKDLGATN
ncbi:MAG: hypothetical protein K2N74_04725, partial [Clostridiales bacterium]|nr:hypothetical protein [Clostridiales bacterium]